jgi:deoxyadenosine/deoxycytidine kinase
MQYPFIAVEGNIGAGKTTLARMLAAHDKSRLVLEQFADNPFLSRFYQDPAQYAFPVELFFLAERYKQLKDVLHIRDIFSQGIVSDYLFTKSLLFAKVTLPPEEFRLFQRLFDLLSPHLPQPDLIIYLHSPVNLLQKHISSRNRTFEQQISDDYLYRIQETYLEYLRQHPVRALLVDIGDADFEHEPAQFQRLTEALKRDYSPGVHHLSLL